MRKVWIAMMLVGAAACASLLPGPAKIKGVVTLEAQTLPLSKTLAWDAGASADSYIVTQDGAQIGTPVALTQPVTITSLGTHTFAVTSVNMWGQSTPTTLTVNVVTPGKSGNVRIQ